jgi:hypothetical protein
VNRGKKKGRAAIRPSPNEPCLVRLAGPLDARPGERGVGEDGIANHRRLAGVPDPVGVRVRLVGVGRLRAVVRAAPAHPASRPFWCLSHEVRLL